MAPHFHSPNLPFLLFFSISSLLPLAKPFTVIVSDSGNQSTLFDGLRNGFSSNTTGARTDAAEQAAVYEIMKATGNDWATGIPDVCRGRWHGIECMLDKDNVYHVVSLSFGALSDDTAFPTCDSTKSYISESITKLPHIRTLFFYRCLGANPQPIPAFLGRLGQTLQTLVLRENGHTGRIPGELGNLTRLKVLDLHRNDLNGSIPVSLGLLTSLRSLDLSGNKLKGSVPGFSFPFLNVLDLSGNFFSGSIPSSLGSCRSLMKMDFSHNRFTGSIPESFGGLTKLILLDLSHNLLSKPLPLALGSLNSLQALILEGNPISGDLSDDVFDGMESLTILVLSKMKLQGPIPESIGRSKSLRVIRLDENQLNGSIPGSLGRLENLSELKLNGNLLSGAVPFGREMVWRMRRKLRLENNPGLCYDANSGFEDGLDSSFDSGIGLCNAPGPGLARTVEHLAIVDRDMPSIINEPSAADRIKDSIFVRSIVPIVGIVLVLLF